MEVSGDIFEISRSPPEGQRVIRKRKNFFPVRNHQGWYIIEAVLGGAGETQSRGRGPCVRSYSVLSCLGWLTKHVKCAIGLG